MSDLNCEHDYTQQIDAIANDLVREAMEQSDNDRDAAEELINDSLLHETIDGHQWVIYCAHNLSVLQYSHNDEYMLDNLGEDSAVEALKSGGLAGLHTALAYWAMYADVQEQLESALDEYEAKQEENV